jgi:hypothetical protein
MRTPPAVSRLPSASNARPNPIAIRPRLTGQHRNVFRARTPPRSSVSRRIACLNLELRSIVSVLILAAAARAESAGTLAQPAPPPQ